MKKHFTNQRTASLASVDSRRGKTCLVTEEKKGNEELARSSLPFLTSVNSRSGKSCFISNGLLSDRGWCISGHGTHGCRRYRHPATESEALRPWSESAGASCRLRRFAVLAPTRGCEQTSPRLGA